LYLSVSFRPENRGIHQSTKSIQARTFYLFQRFVLHTKEQLRRHVPPSITDQIVTSIQVSFCNRYQSLDNEVKQPLLVITAELKISQENGEQDPLVASTRASSFFDSQLSLFEALGNLAHLFNDQPEAQTALLQVCHT